MHAVTESALTWEVTLAKTVIPVIALIFNLLPSDEYSARTLTASLMRRARRGFDPRSACHTRARHQVEQRQSSYESTF